MHFSQDGSVPLAGQAILAALGTCTAAAAATAACSGAITLDLGGMPALAFDPVTGSLVPGAGARVAAAFGVATGSVRRVVSQVLGTLRVEV